MHGCAALRTVGLEQPSLSDTWRQLAAGLGSSPADVILRRTAAQREGGASCLCAAKHPACTCVGARDGLGVPLSVHLGCLSCPRSLTNKLFQTTRVAHTDSGIWTLTSQVKRIQEDEDEQAGWKVQAPPAPTPRGCFGCFSSHSPPQPATQRTPAPSRKAGREWEALLLQCKVACDAIMSDRVLGAARAGE